MQLDEIINKHKQDLNATDMVIWKYIVMHRQTVRHISIHELARLLGVIDDHRPLCPEARP